MISYTAIVEKLIEDHFTEDQKERLAQKLLEGKRPAPKSMTKEQERINHYLKYLERL